MSYSSKGQVMSKELELEKKIEKAEKEARRRAIRERKPIIGLEISQDPAVFDESGRKKPGEDNWVKYGFHLHPQVTFFSTAILTVFILLSLMYIEHSAAFFSGLLETITCYAGWFFVLSVNLIIVAILFFAFSRFGCIIIGGKDAVPEFSTFSWLAMLLSAGMGIGLMFWSVGEPIMHYMAPSPIFEGVDAGTSSAAQAAMTTTFFHWGVHPWAVYALVGLGLAFFTFNRGLPLTIRSIFYPVLGNRIYGFWGNIIDVLSVLATLAGLATSLGFGVQQVNAGLFSLTGLTISTTNQVYLIIIITAMATMSVVSGLDRGVKILSEINMITAALFMLFMLAVGPTVHLLGSFSQNIGNYIARLPELSFWTETFEETNWQGGWTVFYWAWWISWSPFVGMFIARISRGRSVREFVAGVIIVPVLLSFMWMTVFGGTAIYVQNSGAVDISGQMAEHDVSIAMFEMLKSFPFSGILSLIGIILVTIFFVTSSDSGSLVVNHLTSGGMLVSPVPQRVFWASMEGLLAIILLLGGGLETLQTASITTALPFTVVLLFIIYSLYIGFTRELMIENIVEEKVSEVEQKHFVAEVVSEVIKT